MYLTGLIRGITAIPLSFLNDIKVPFHIYEVLIMHHILVNFYSGEWKLTTTQFFHSHLTQQHKKKGFYEGKHTERLIVVIRKEKDVKLAVSPSAVYIRNILQLSLI